MNRPIKRLLAFAGAATVGLFGALLFAAPAHAHHPIIEGTAVCQANGEFKITWSVGNGNWSSRTAKILTMSANPNTAVTGFGVDTEIAPSAEVEGTQTVPGTTTTATLTVKAQWFNPNGSATDIIEERTGEATGFDKGCEPEPKPTATFVSKCDGTVNVHIVNKGSAATFKVTGVGDVSVGAGAEKDVLVPAGTAGPIVVTKGTETIGEYAGWVRPEACEPPSVIGESTCDKFTLNVTNPQGGQSTEVKVTYGTQVKSLTLAPGKTEPVELTPSSETEALVEFSGWGREKVKYTKPANCPGLPQTGDNTAGYLASGAGLIGVGVVVFFLARRRMVRLRQMAS